MDKRVLTKTGRRVESADATMRSMSGRSNVQIPSQKLFDPRFTSKDHFSRSISVFVWYFEDRVILQVKHKQNVNKMKLSRSQSMSLSSVFFNSDKPVGCAFGFHVIGSFYSSIMMGLSLYI